MEVRFNPHNVRLTLVSLKYQGVNNDIGSSSPCVKSPYMGSISPHIKSSIVTTAKYLLRDATSLKFKH